jgi:hypothetical protein
MSLFGKVNLVIPSVAAAATRALLQPSVASPELAEGEVEGGS